VPRLLERQQALLSYLTSPAAIFGAGPGRVDTRLAGIDRRRLHLEARFSHDKRMEKIRGILPKTFDLLGANLSRVMRDFAAACPPDDISRIHNARQFQHYLRRRWERRSARRPYLADVAACELALAEARSFAEDHVTPIRPAAARLTRVRRRPGVLLVRCRYDVRPVFEGGNARIARRPTFLAVAVPPGAIQPAVAELAAPVFKLLATLDTPHPRAGIGHTKDAEALIEALAAEGLVDLCP